MTIETEVANPLRMLSAYFITAATTRPPKAYENTKEITHLYEHTYVYMYKYISYRISVVNLNVHRHVDLHIDI